MSRRKRGSADPAPVSFARIRRRYAELQEKAALERWPPQILAGVVETMLVEEWAQDPEGWEQALDLALDRLEQMAPALCAACGAADPDIRAGLTTLCALCADRAWAEDWEEMTPGA